MKKKKIVFVFDFDQTLTMYHSGGLPELEVDYIERMDLLLPMLEKLNQRGIVVYINTRGIAADVKLYLKKKLDGPDKVLWIRDVYGADSEENIGDALLPDETAFNRIDDLVIKTLGQRKDMKDPSSRVWAYQKSVFLEDIATREGVTDKADVYFFDDTAINVEYAKTNGFTNSFRIFDGTDSSDPSLITTNQQYLEYTNVLVEQILSTMELT